MFVYGLELSSYPQKSWSIWKLVFFFSFGGGERYVRISPIFIFTKGKVKNVGLMLSFGEGKKMGGPKIGFKP